MTNTRSADDLIGPTAQKMISSPLAFGFICLVLTLFTWPLRWLVSGAPLLQFILLLGDSRGQRVLPSVHAWPLFTTLHLVYAISSTSWLLYWIFFTLCYPAIVLVCLFQFDWAARTARNLMRKVVAGLHFIDDKVAFFEIPALEIDHEVDGLLVFRGVTFSLSTLSFVVHGIEVGIKLTQDMELAIQTEEVRVKLFRRVDVGPIFINIKGGKYEMTFGSLPTPTINSNGDAMFIGGTDILKAASKGGDLRRPELVTMTSQFTGGKSPGASTPREGLGSMEKISGTDGEASKKYQKRLRFIEETNAINELRKHIRSADNQLDEQDESKLQAAICSALHSTPSVPHPPDLAIKVTTIKSMSKPSTKRFIHRLPLLLRLLLNPICYFHPVFIESITASASGRWIDTLLLSELFKNYHEQDKEIASLHSRISAWLSDANFVLELDGIKGLAQVPINYLYDLQNYLTFDKVKAFRSIPRPNTNFHDLSQVLSLAGADLNVTLPSYLLPRHEHLLPPKPVSTNSSTDSVISTSNLSTLGTNANPLLAPKDPDDYAIMKVAAHVKLPAILNQDLLDFTAILVKASKIVELEKELETINTPSNSNPTSPTLTPIARASTMSVADDASSISSVVSEAESEISTISEREDDEGKSRRRAISNKLKGGFRVGMKRMVVDTVVNERWIARLVGRVTRKLEKAKGEVGYAADVRLPLAYYRAKGEGEAEKILP